MCAKMSMASQPLIELLRNTPPPPLAGRQESVRPIPPPPLCPPPLTILKMVPPPPLPSHLARMCPPSVMQVNTGQMMANNSYSSTVSQRTLKGGTETNYQDAGRVQAKRGPSKPARPIHCSARDSRSRDVKDGNAARSRDATEGAVSRPRDLMEGVVSRSRDVLSGHGCRSRDCDMTADAAEDDELVNVLKHLVTLFTMTSQVKVALSRVRLKTDDPGIQHQVSRTRALVETFREQLARRTVTLGRLIPPDTTGKPEIPRELRTKDPAGGDVSPRPDVCSGIGSPPAPISGQTGQESPGTAGVTTQSAISSLQALVSGDAEPSAAGASRWSSRVKRRFLAASRPVRRITERLKAPHCPARWQSSSGSSSATTAEAAPSSATAAPSSSPSSPPSSCCSSEDGRADYFSPGCYVIDGAGRPVSVVANDAPTATAAATGTAAGGAADAKTAAATVFGVPLSVLVAEAAKKKKKQQATAANCCGAEDSPRAAAGAGAGAADSCRRDRSWLTSRGSSSSQRLVSDPSDLRDALDGLVRLRVEDDPPPAAPATADAAGQRRGGGRQERDQEDREEAEEATGGADAEDWMTSSFDEDWFLSTEREQEEERRREQEEERRCKEQERRREEERARREAEGECVDRKSRQDKQKEETTGRGNENEDHIF